MDFQGRQILASDFLEYFENYETTFLNNIKTIKPNISNEETSIYSMIIKNLLLKDFTHEKFTQEYKKTNINFKIEILSYALIKLSIDFSTYLLQNNYNAQNITFLNNAFDELLKITSVENSQIIDNTQTIQEQNKVKPVETIKIPTMSSGNGFSLRENFTDSFAKMHSSNTPIEFLNLFKGVPIRSMGTILGIDGDTITVRADTMQILAMQEEKNAYIVANEFIDKNVCANLVLPNAIAKMVSLNNFKTQEFMHALKRKYPRVHPNKFTKVLLTNQDAKTINGKLFDISEGGIGVVSAEDNGFKNGEQINAKFELVMPDTQETISLDLNFKLIVLVKQFGAFRYCLEILSNQENVNIISEFSKQRVEDTLQELKNMLKNYEK